MKTKLCVIVVALLNCFSGSVWGISWGKTEIEQGPDSGKMVSTVVDRMGRVHIAYVEAAGITGDADDEAGLVYEIRQTASFDFTPLLDNPDVAFFPSGTVPLYMDMDVSYDLTVQIAIVDKEGKVRVFERAKDASTWTETEVAIGATTNTSKGGLSIRSAGNGATRGGIAYTRSMSLLTDPGTARFIEEIGPGNWTSPVTIFAGAGSGIAARLVNTPQGVQGSSTTRRVVAAYDEVNERVHISRQTQSFINGTPLNLWRPAEEIISLSDVTRPDIEYANKQIGVTSADLTTGVRYHTRRLMGGAAGDNYADYSWNSQQVNSPDEVDSELGLLVQPHAPLAYDSSGAPLIAYSRFQFAIFSGETLDIRTKRLVDGLGWEDSIVDTPLNSGSNKVISAEALDLSISSNGDPALAYRWQDGPGADPKVKFARPNPAPWVMERASNTRDLSQTRAPTVASGLNGNLHMVVSGATGNVILGTPFQYEPRRLITFSGQSEISVDIPSSAIPYVSNAVTVTTDGIVHIVGLRLADETSEQGDVFYSFGPPEGPIMSGGLVGTQTNKAIPGALILKNDSAGNLYCANLKTGGGFTVRKLARGSSIWQTIHTFDGNTIGLDMDVRADGGFAICHLSGSNITVATTVDPRNGALRALSTYTYTVTDSLPADTAVVFAGDSRPRVAYPSGGILNYLTPRRTGGAIGLFQKTVLAINHLGAVLEMESSGNFVHVMAHSSVSGGTLNHISVKNDLVDQRAAFSVPALNLTTASGRQSLSTTIDRNGFPVMAVGLASPTILFGTSNSVLLCRPADGMDRDNDGIPVLLEEAHCLGDDFPHSTDMLTQGSTRQTSTFINTRFEFRRPDLFGRSLPDRREYGDFSIAIESSTDLKQWEVTPVIPGQTAELIVNDVGTDEGDDCIRTAMGYFYFKGQPDVGPRVFNRLTIRRVR